MSRKYEPAGPPRFGHQKRALSRLVRQGGSGALLIDPGLGKTSIVIDLMNVLALKKQGEVRVLVTCPLAAVDTWVKQMDRFTSPEVSYWAEALGGSITQRAEALAARGGNGYSQPIGGAKGRTFSKRDIGTAGLAGRALHSRRSIALERRPDGPHPAGPDDLPKGPRIVLEVVNMDAFKSRSTVGSRTMADVMLNSIQRFGPDLLVVDESHRIKGASSNVSRLMARATDHCKRRLILTGTVMPSGPLDVFAQWRFLDPYAFGTVANDGSPRKATFAGFKARFCQMGGFMGHEVVGYRNLDELHEVMGRLAIVARKEEALDLPPTTDLTLTVHLSPAEKKAYQDMKKDLGTRLSNGDLVTTQSRLTAVMRLRQITSGHLPDDDGTVHVIGRSKVNAIRSLVQDSLTGEKRVVIFALFTREIEMLAEALQDSETEVQVISGATPSSERMRLRERFGSDDPQRMVMVAQIKTMSLAVNELVTASHAIFASFSQQRDDMVQARDRLNRLGQVKPTFFHYAVAPGTVDEVIRKSHEERTDMESSVLRHILEEPGP